MWPNVWNHTNKQAIPLFPGQNLINNVRVSNKFLTGSLADVITVSSHLNFDTQAQSLEGDAPEDLDFSDVVLKYINHILMEEDVEEKACMFQESAALQAAERSFYEVIGRNILLLQIISMWQSWIIVLRTLMKRFL
ncbi:Scarecrow-like protein 14 [Sesamum angolense]|uniref:Scarecrow-like protein 14 n=1 Tax=Sesamum angolense TaxID=2727404 RepID=A0AAE1X1N9_9LAMI|nr:Scarecrow-like protein 14 [Sesamum angolense]